MYLLYKVNVEGQISWEVNSKSQKCLSRGIESQKTSLQISFLRKASAEKSIKSELEGLRCLSDKSRFFQSDWNVKIKKY